MSGLKTQIRVRLPQTSSESPELMTGRPVLQPRNYSMHIVSGTISPRYPVIGHYRHAYYRDRRFRLQSLTPKTYSFGAATRRETRDNESLSARGQVPSMCLERTRPVKKTATGLHIVAELSLAV
jgi:hypothetical protein